MEYIYILNKLLLLQFLMCCQVKHIFCGHKLSCSGMEDTRKCGICALCFNKYAKIHDKIKVVGYECQPQRFNLFEAPPKCDFVDKCIGYPCKNNASCITNFGTALCVCGESNYGQTCEFSKADGNEYVTDIKVIYKPIIKALTVTEFLITFNGLFSNILVQVHDGQQQVVTLSSKAFRRSNPRRVCLTNNIASPSLCHTLPNDNDYFYTIVSLYYRAYPSPHRSHIIYKNTASGGKQKTGYVNTFDVVISNTISSQILFSESYGLVVYSVKDLEACPVLINFQNCAKTSMAPTKFTRTEERTIRGYVDRPDTCHVIRTTWKWVIWRFGQNFDETRNIRVYEATDQHNFVIQPFSLKSGVYKVRLTADIIYGEKQIATDFAYCFFEIVDMSLIAVISGGSSRTAYANASLVLNASDSEDPNEPHNRQFHLILKWSCDKKESFCKPYVTKSRTYKVDGPFLPGQTYRFELTVSGKHLRTVTTSQSILMTASKVPNFMIICYYNCGSKSVGANPDLGIYLMVEIEGKKVPKHKEFTWSLEENGEIKTNIHNITYTNLPSHVCIVRPHVLDAGKMYTFIVKRLDGYSVSTVNVKVHKRPTRGVCNVTPTEGYALNTPFKIACLNFEADAVTNVLTYEFYNSRTNEEGLGILIESNTNGLILSKWLSHSNLQVKVIDFYGMYLQVNLNVKVKPLVYISDIDRAIRFAMSKVNRQDYAGATTLLSLVSEHLDTISYPHRFKYIVKMLEIVKEDNMKDIKDLKRMLAVVYRILYIGVGNKGHGISSKVAWLASQLFYYVCFGLYEIVATSNNTVIIDHAELKKISFSIFISIFTVMEETEAYVKQHDINLNYFSLKFQTLLGPSYASLLLFLKFLHCCILPAQEPILIMTNNSILYSKADLPSMFVIAGKIPQEGRSYVVIDKYIAEELESAYGYVTLQVAVTETNPYWYERGPGRILVHTEVVYFKLSKKVINEYFKEFISHLQNPIDLRLKIKEVNYSVVKGCVSLPRPEEGDDEKDKAVVVYRLNCPNYGGSSLVRVQFQNMSQGQVLRVTIMYAIWPDYNYMIENSTIVTGDSPLVDLIVFCANENTFSYIGILPGPEHPVGAVINYTFYLYIVQCLTRIRRAWTPEHCTVSGHLT